MHTCTKGTPIIIIIIMYINVCACAVLPGNNALYAGAYLRTNEHTDVKVEAFSLSVAMLFTLVTALLCILYQVQANGELTVLFCYT